MKKIAFTICAKNYIGLAQTLEKSILKYDPTVDFFIFVADEFTDPAASALLPENVFIAKEKLAIPVDQWYQMAFKYDLTEFCTSIKPSCFKYLFAEFNADACIYFDPDILVFNNLDIIYNQLQEFSILLTPHITTIQNVYSGDLMEDKLLYSGIYNLGFLGLKNDHHAAKMLNWWEIRLKDKCFQNKMENLFTDQKWMDFMPAYFPKQTLVSCDLGLNVAPWNFYDREIIIRDGKKFVRSRLDADHNTSYGLTFVHFSGYDYKSLLNSEVVQGNIKGMETTPDLRIIFDEYGEYLRNSNFSKFIQQPYSYFYFSNGSYVSMTYRKLFRRLLEDGKITSNPFDAYGDFYKALKDSRLLNEKMASSDKSSVSNVSGVESKTLRINKLLKLCFKLIGPEKFFLLVRLMRLYSKIENHPYLIDGSYLKRFKIWN
ncbi:MAG: hypothetical protein V4594_02235 [Bacteroidota bacterium]